jgi:sugar/nucleoside kinase (ribokinase family)
MQTGRQTAPHAAPGTRHPALPDFVIVGNVARDVVPGGWRPGGTAVYAAGVARGLGRRVGLVTAATEDVVRAGLPDDVQVMRHPAGTSTSYENVYTPEGRIQYLRAAGEPLPPGAVPAAWVEARVALIGPVYHEVDASVAERFLGLVGICAQGYLRRADADGRVRPLPPDAWDVAPLLRRARALFLSEEDIALDAGDAPSAWAEMVPILVVTDGRHGARIHADGGWRHVPAFAACEVDPTGAGDAFAAGYLVALDEGADPWTAARFGAAAASFVVEAVGPVTPDRAAVERRIAEGRTETADERG